MSIAFDAEIDVDALESAQRRLAQVVETVGSGAGLSDVQMHLRAAVNAVEDEGTYEKRLEDATTSAELAVEGIEEFKEFAQMMHVQGRVKTSNETFDWVIGELNKVLGDIAEWADKARADLDSLD